MSITTFNKYPYYDDFDERNNYMRILFRPGYSVQARELNQLQTSIQAQIDRFGSSIYKENSKVLGGEVSVNNSVPYVKVESNYLNFSVEGDVDNGISSYLQQDDNGKYIAIGKIIRGTLGGSSVNDSGNLRAEIVDVIPPVYESLDGSSSIKYPLTLQIRYLNSGGTPNSSNDGLVKGFSPDEVLIAEDNTFSFKTLSLNDGIYPTGFGTRLSIEQAIYFVKGCFVHVPKESINVSTYSQTPYRRVVYNIIENEVSSNQDPSLNDNSVGTPNESAPGANRYQIVLSLSLESFDSHKNLGRDIIEVAKIRDGRIYGTEMTQYSELAKVLARRTYEESGNYYLSPIPLKSNELLKNVNDLDSDYHNGLYSSNQIVDFYGNINPKSRLGLTVGKGGNVLYVYGYRIEFLDSQIISTLKARDTNTKNNSSIDSEIGNYLICSIDDSSASLDLSINYEPIEIYNSNDILIATARIRNVEYHSSTQLKVFLSNVQKEIDENGSLVDSLGNASYLLGETGTGFVLNVNESSFISENNHSYVFKNPCDVTKTVGDISYVVRDSITTSNTAASDNQITISVKNSYEEFEYTGINSFLILDIDNNSIVDFESISISQNNKTATISFNSANSIPNNFTVYFNIKRTESGTTTSLRRKKILTTVNQIIETPNRDGGGIDKLLHYDIKRIIGIYTVSENAQSGTNPTPSDLDITNHYILDNGQRENYYDLGGIRLRCGCEGPPEGSKILVQYEYYEWGAGEYSTVDSYYSTEELNLDNESFAYETIPSFNSKRYGLINLRDVIDFRPKIENIENQSAITLARFPRVTGDFTQYLPRIDKVYVKKDGGIGIVSGLSAEKPTAPQEPEEVMVLYTLRMNPYTFHPDDFSRVVHNHRRYTMKDIGKLDERITNLEKFTQLNSIEVETGNEQILDENGDDRFVNGFISDTLNGHLIGLTDDLEYSVSVNPITGGLYPSTENNEFRFVFESSSGTYKRVGSNLLLNYVEVKHSGNPHATKGIGEEQSEDPVLGYILPGVPVSITMTADKSYLAPDEEITFYVKSEGIPDGVSLYWVLNSIDVLTPERDTGRQTGVVDFGLIRINNNESTFKFKVPAQLYSSSFSDSIIVREYGISLREPANLSSSRVSPSGGFPGLTGSTTRWWLDEPSFRTISPFQSGNLGFKDITYGNTGLPTSVESGVQIFEIGDEFIGTRNQYLNAPVRGGFGTYYEDNDLGAELISANFVTPTRSPYDLVDPITFKSGPELEREDRVTNEIYPRASAVFRWTKGEITPGGQFTSNKFKISVLSNTLSEGTTLYWWIDNFTSSNLDEAIYPEDFSDNLGLSGTMVFGSNNIAEIERTVASKLVLNSFGNRANESVYARSYGYEPRTVPAKSIRFTVSTLPKDQYFSDSNKLPNGTYKPVDFFRSTSQIVIFDNSEAQPIPGLTNRSILPTVINDFETVEGNIVLSPRVDNYYENSVKPIIALDDELQGIFDVIKNNPSSNDEFISKYIWEGDSIYWTGKDLFDVETSTNNINFQSTFGESFASFRNNFAISGSLTSPMFADTNEIRYTSGGTTVSEELIQKVRSRKIYFKASSLKPNTVYFPYLNSTRIDNYVCVENVFVNFSDDFSNESVTLYTGEKFHPVSGPNPNLRKLKTDSRGELIGSFIIPNNDEMSFDSRTDINFLLVPVPDRIQTRSLGDSIIGSAIYRSDGRRKITNKFVYVYLPDDSQGYENYYASVNRVADRRRINQNLDEGYEYKNENDKILSTNVRNLNKINYFIEKYEETIEISTSNSGAKEISRNLTLINVQELSSITFDDYQVILNESKKTLSNIPHHFNNVSGLYLYEGSSSSIDYALFGKSKIESDRYIRTLRDGTYKVYYIRLMSSNEVDNNRNPISITSISNTSNQFEIGKFLERTSSEINTKPSDLINI